MPVEKVMYIKYLATQLLNLPIVFLLMNEIASFVHSGRAFPVRS